jgi:hypothetical protein
MSKEVKEENTAKGFETWMRLVYKGLSAPFPKEAFSTDSSRGFDLTSIKAQYVVERLNEVIGLEKWRHTGVYELVDNGVVFKGQLIISNSAIDDKAGCVREAVGFATIKRNVGDAYKGAKTDSLSKCASMFGLGNEVYKGNVAPPSKTKPRAAKPKANLKAANNDF